MQDSVYKMFHRRKLGNECEQIAKFAHQKLAEAVSVSSRAAHALPGAAWAMTSAAMAGKSFQAVLPA